MSCIFQTLHFSDKGFVARCKHCGHFHVAFMSAMFIMPEAAYYKMCSITQDKLLEKDYSPTDNSKCVMIPMHTKSAFIMLTRQELLSFAEMLEDADNEYKALALISLFNEGNQTNKLNE